MNPPLPTNRPLLLVSVRNAAEARTCLPWVDVLDLKEPRRGPLGAVEWQQLRAVAGLCPKGLPLSVALGELNDVAWELVEAIPAAQPAVRFAKVGLAGQASRHDWLARLKQLRDRLPRPVELVPAAYADWPQVQAPAPEEILQAACELDGRTFMLDTACKDGRRLWDHLSLARVEQLVEQAHARGCRVVLAGSLQAADIPRVFALQAEVLAVRGAVCRRGREHLDQQLLAALGRRLRQEAAGREQSPQFA